MGDSDVTTSVPENDMIRTRVVESSICQWVLADADRWLVAGGLILGVFTVFLVFGSWGLLAVTNESTVTLLLSALIAGNRTLVTITIPINSSSPASSENRIRCASATMGSRNFATRLWT